MTILKNMFCGKIIKAEHKTAGEKQICEVSLCKKVSARGKDPEYFDWVRVTIWTPPEWAIPRLVKGNYISGIGDMTMRPYEKDGVKKYSLEVRCSSYDFEVEELAERTTDAPVAAAPVRAAATRKPIADDEPPF